MSLRTKRIEALLDSPGLAGRLTPLSQRVTSRVSVPEDLVAAFPQGGVPRGWQLAVVGHGAWTTAMRLWAAMLHDDGWLAVVGLPDLGLAALAEQGVRLDRVVVVETPPGDLWFPVIDTLIESFTVVAVGPPDRASRAQARRLAVRVREQGAVMVHLASDVGGVGGLTWPEPFDCVLECTASDWEGIGAGHGYLRSRRVEVAVGGRRRPPHAGSVGQIIGSGRARPAR